MRNERRNVAPVWEYWTCHLVHSPQHDSSRCSGPVGGPRRRWLAEEVHNLAPPVLSPRGNGDRQPSRRTQPKGPPTRGFRSLRTSSKGDTCLKVIFGSLSVFGLVPFLHLRPVSCLFRARSPQKRKRAGRADQRRQATNPKSDQAQTQSDSHQQATGTAPRKKAPKVYFGGPIVKLFRNLKPTLSVTGIGASRFSAVLVHEKSCEDAMSNPTLLPPPSPPFVTVRAGT